MPAIPAFVLRKLYAKGSLQAEAGGFSLKLKNLIAPGTITGILSLELDGRAVDLAQLSIIPPSGNVRPAPGISAQSPLQFPVGADVRLVVSEEPLEAGAHELILCVVVKEVGPLDIPISENSQ